MILTLRPRFIGWTVLLSQLPIQLFMTVWAGGFFGGISSSLLGLKGSTPFLVFGTAAFLGVPIGTFFIKKLNYSVTSYRLLDDRVEFEEGFFSKNVKTVRYKDVLEVTMKQGLLQRPYGLGSIYLATMATGSNQGNNAFTAFGFGNVSASGVGLRDIADPEPTYEQVRRLIEAAKLPSPA